MAVACGDFHTLVVGERGLQVFACGDGGSGQLGGGTRTHQRVLAPVPALPEAPEGERFVMVAAGAGHSAASTSAGELLTWGRGYNGQLGHGDREDRVAPVRLGRVQFGGSPVVMVACGRTHTIAITAAGQLFSFGAGGRGQLGLDDTNDRDVPVEVGETRFGGARIVYAAAGDYHSGAVTSEGRVFTWGVGDFGRLGHGNEEDQLAPTELTGQFGGSGAVMMAAGVAQTMVLTADGALWGFGYGRNGRLGVGDTGSRLVPARVGAEGAFGACKVLMVACGNAHTISVTEEGELWAWGHGKGGRLGHNDERDRLAPERVGAELLGGVKIVTAACGTHHSAAVSEEGALYTWGAAQVYVYGSQELTGLGHEDLEDKRVPSLVATRLLLGARLGRCLPLSRSHALAISMGTHGRLGAPEPLSRGVEKASERQQSAILALAGESGLVQMVVKKCGDWPEGAAGEAAGVVRLLGGGGELIRRIRAE